jgi:uncharacterized protein
MKRKLLIVFVKNNKLGKVKTRLAKTIGDEGAFEIYKALLAITEEAIHAVDADKSIYFSEFVDETTWSTNHKEVQFGIDLGAKMKNAFADGFEKDYDSIVLIGSDLPDITATVITDAFDALNQQDIVFGPAQDGGYYLIGMNKMHKFVFENKPWSQPNLLTITLNELAENNSSCSLLATLNDIDTYDDLIAANFYKNNTILQNTITQLND